MLNPNWSVLAGRYEIRDIHLVEENVLETLKVKADFHNFKPRPFNMREFYDRTGHDINDMLLSCHFHGTECRAEDFKVVSSLHYSSCGCRADQTGSKPGPDVTIKQKILSIPSVLSGIFLISYLCVRVEGGEHVSGQPEDAC